MSTIVGKKPSKSKTGMAFQKYKNKNFYLLFLIQNFKILIMILFQLLPKYFFIYLDINFLKNHPLI